jgi:predicted dehydrogenase
MSVQRLRALVVGVGSIGEKHVRCLQFTKRVDIAICEPAAITRDAVAKQYGIRDSFASLDAATKESFDLAIVATPAPFHIPQATFLVENGIHVLIEKPLSIDTTGIANLKQLAAHKQLVTGVAYSYRAHPALASMHRCIKSDELGRPLQVSLLAGQSFPTYRPAYRNTYYRARSSGGGAIQDALSHMINTVEWLVGPTTNVVGDAERLKLDGVEVEDTTHVLARNGPVLTSYSLNQHQPANELSLTVVCEHGQARFEGHRSRWVKITEVDGNWQEQSFENLDRDTVFLNQANAFLDSIEGKHPPLCSLDEGCSSLKSVLAILKSLETRRWEAVSFEQKELRVT